MDVSNLGEFDAFILDIELGCANYEHGISVAQRIIENNPAVKITQKNGAFTISVMLSFSLQG